MTPREFEELWEKWMLRGMAFLATVALLAAIIGIMVVLAYLIVYALTS